MDYEYKILRCQWEIVVQQVDQYGKNISHKTLEVFPNREMAVDNLEKYGVGHPYVQGRWIPKNPNHGYEILEILYKEIPVPHIPSK